MTTLMTYLATHSTTPEVVWCAASWLRLRERAEQARTGEAGMTTETVIITAGLAALAVTLVAIIGTRVRSRARQIP